MSRFYTIILISVLYFLFDWYVFQAIRMAISEWSLSARRVTYIIYFTLSISFFLGALFYRSLDPQIFKNLRLFLLSGFLIMLVGKLFAAIFLLIDDARRGVVALINLLPQKETPIDASRSEFMGKAALIAGAVPVVTFSFGILSGAHDYRVRKRVLHLKNLPKSFDGIRVAQISDIHTGSFFNKTAVAGGVDLINAQKADIVFFTGDLVNSESAEAKPYLDIFKKVKAPMGVYSTMGNHDYGDYSSWSSQEAKQKDISNLHDMHRYMGWDILLNENRVITEGDGQMAILGLENWGAGRFSKYGDMERTIKGTEEIPFKLLLSHDPSHWDAQILKEYPGIDLSLAGHTHGMQFGIEIGDFRWSPSKYIYDRWADLYQEGDQYLYVNRGYGFIGYPGRVGILPEITILELKSV
ncbi:metallophosphoesterase [Marinoscillum sp. MHG1-6]|uniref:metallophosphoesterase n=1 Tax=Marinoscillum sp. MHG1-6 TaxID=2959627 RepID=UPI00215745C2|nr:metallophosphoesterase [Marinoscillum sp. MHG1-6]